MNQDIQAIKNILRREAVRDDGADDLPSEAEEHFARILQNAVCDGEEAEASASIEAIRAFMAADESKRRKVLSYCVDFHDPTVSQERTEQVEGVRLHALLGEDELSKLFKFVKRHQEDGSFGDTVYKIMDEHGMTAPEVYKGVSLRRQDFQRVTDPRCQSVTRRIAWQIIVGLHCSSEEADDVLFSAGYVRRKTRLDLVMQYFVDHGIYDIQAIDAVLFDLGLKPYIND